MGDDTYRIPERLAALKAGREGALAQIQAELARERAYAHARAVEKVEVAFAKLAEAAAALVEHGGAEVREAYEAARKHALQVRWELEVHREAMGIYRPEDMERDFPIPPRVR